VPATDSMSPATVTRLRLAVLRLARRIRQHGSADITPSQLAALASVARHGPVSLGALARHEGIQPPSVTRIVASLEREGLVARQEGADRRVCLVVATGKGEDLLEQVRRRGATWLAERLDGLGDDDRDALARAVPVLERLLAQEEA
jgi:DNA-binding MarR family transcriptional regulator